MRKRDQRIIEIKGRQMRGESEFYPVPRAIPLCLVQPGFAYCLKQLIHSVPQAFMLRFLQAGVGF